MLRGRRTTRWTVAAALACGVVAAGVTTEPSAAQEAPTTTAPPAPATTVAPPTTAEPAPPPPTTGAGDAAPPSTAPDAAGGSPTETTATTEPAPLADDEVAAPAPGAITFDIPAGAQVVDGQALGVTVTGLGDVEYVDVMQCTVGDEPTFQRCQFENVGFAIVDGAVHLTLRVDAVIATGGYDGTPLREADCRAEPCEIVVESWTTVGERATMAAPLPFDPDGALAPPPTATVSPAGPYVHGQSVTVRAAGLVWDTSASVVQCVTGTGDPYACDQSSDRYLDLGAGDSAEMTTRLYAVIDTASGPVDCRVAEACELVVVQGRSLSPAKSVRLPLPFDPATEVVPPTLTITPADGLVHGQEVTATGSGFTDQFLQFSQCAGVDGQPETCIWLQAYAQTDPAGTFTTTVRVSAFVPTAAGEVDCRDADSPCTLVASYSSPRSSRAGRASLRFDPDAPLPPPPAITVTPAADLPEEAAVTVAGTGFGALDQGPAEVSVCRAGTGQCDEAARAWVDVGSDGRFTTDVVAAASFTTWDGTVVDCRAAPGCEVVARDGYEGRRATAPIAFGESPTMADRYRLPLFDGVEVTSNVVYRRTTDASGAAVDLTLDVYEPAGDTVERRPVVVWLSGGWFGSGQAPTMRPYAEAFARRGYVSVTMSYRGRPGLVCCPTNDIEGVTAAVADATDDADAGVRWLRDHAADYGIDPDAISIGGAQGGAAAAFGLAHVVDAPIAAAVPIDGVGFGRPDAGEAPFLAVHQSRSTVAPSHLSEWACTRARALGTACSTAVFPASYEDLVQNRQRSIVAEASAFIADVALAPRGYVEHSGRDWAGSGGPDGPGGPGAADPLGTVVPGPLVQAVTAAVTGRLPATGAGVGHLAATGLALVLVGGAVLAARRRGWRVVDRGGVRLWVAAGSAVVLVVAGFAVTSALGPDGGTDETTGGRPAEREDADAATGDVDHDAMDHGDDHADADHSDHATDADHDALNHGRVDHDASGHGSEGTGHPHGSGSGSRSADTHGHGAGTASGGEHEHPADPGEPAHEHPAGPSPPEHEHPGPTTPDHPHPEPPEPPVTGFDPAWTPEQVAYANQLIADTQEQLERYDNLAILPLTGYQWIRDGQQVDTYQHWIHLGRIVDARRLDPEYPESLVLRTTPDGPVLEAAMYMLQPGFHLGNIPADIAWLPDWHIHDNLCFENGFDLVGVTVNGRCERGSVIVTPPMIHVWREPTRCGWFAGVDEFGLQCHEH